MNPSKKFLKTFLIIGIGIYLLWRPALSMLEIPVWGPGWAMGEWLVKRDLPISYCTWVKNPWWGIFGPTTGEQVLMCIGSYAEINPDPGKCSELSGFLSQECLSNIRQKIFTGITCHMTYGQTSLFCQKNNYPLKVAEKAQIKNCSAYKQPQAIEWCHYMRSAVLPDVNECDQMKNEQSADECNMEYAFKLKDRSLCEVIEDVDRRKYCEVKIDLWIKNPELREDDFFTGNKKALAI